VRSRPCTITGSPLRIESRTWSASVRQAVTVYHAVSPSTQLPSFRNRGVTATRKVATLTSFAVRCRTSLPAQPWKVTKVSFISAPRSSVCLAASVRDRADTKQRW